MPARKRRNRSSRHMLAYLVIAIAVILAVDFAMMTLQYLGWLIMTAGIAGATWHVARRTSPAATASRELSQLRAENERLTGELADARESAHAAWDAAASREPAPVVSIHGARDTLLRDPRSGVRPLTGPGK